MPTDHEQSPSSRVEAVEGEDAVILKVGGEEYERIPVDADDVSVVTNVIQAILGDSAYLVPEDCDPGE